MKSVQDLMMYASLFTICSLCIVLSDRTVVGKTLVDDSVDRNNLDLKNMNENEKPIQNNDDKRKWSEYATWGKRKWDGVPAWGKRWSEGLTSWGKREQDTNSLKEAKRQWNQFVTWGKRSGADDKRKDWSSFTSWGKRGKWQNFNTWGKRDVSSEGLENAITEKVLNLFDDNGDHGLNRNEMLAFVNWLRTTGGDDQIPEHYLQ